MMMMTIIIPGRVSSERPAENWIALAHGHLKVVRVACSRCDCCSYRRPARCAQVHGTTTRPVRPSTPAPCVNTVITSNYNCTIVTVT